MLRPAAGQAPFLDEGRSKTVDLTDENIDEYRLPRCMRLTAAFLHADHNEKLWINTKATQRLKIKNKQKQSREGSPQRKKQPLGG